VTRKPRRQRREEAKAARGLKSVERSALPSEEKVVMTARPARIATIPKYVVTLGLYELWRRRNTAMVTDQRILFGSGILSRSEKSIPLRDVTDVSFNRRGLNSYAQVAVHHRGRDTVKEVGPMSSSAAKRFVAEILRRT
jgi:hypothetical protein